MVFPVPPPIRPRALLAGALLLLAGCSGGENKKIVVPMVKADIGQGTPLQTDGIVIFNNITKNGDVIGMDVAVHDSTGNITLDDVDLVLRYDASFIQVLSLSGQNTLFGTCNTVNPVCGVNSPICTDNRVQANAGGERFCRRNGSTFCTTDADCPTPGDACGSWGRLEATFAVLTGPKLCSDDSSKTCAQNSDCAHCTTNTATACASNADCGGTCSAGFCSNIPSRSCSFDPECNDPCVFATCRGCPAVLVSGTQRIASLTLRVLKEGTSEFRFVISSNPSTPGSAARKDLVDQPVLFFPNVDGDNPSTIVGAITVVGSL